MDFQLSEEEEIINDSLKGWLSRKYTFSDWQQNITDNRGYSSENWKTFAEMGWLGLSIPDEFDGSGLGYLERNLVAEAFGRHLVTEPYFSTAVLSADLVNRIGSLSQKKDILPKIVAGEMRLAFAHAEKASRFSLQDLSTQATQSGADYLLNGEKILVLDAESADRFLVLARNGDSVGVFLVGPDAKGIDQHVYKTVDDRIAADITFNDTPAILLGDPNVDQHTAIEEICDKAIIYLCAEGLGAMEALFEQTVEYLKTRKQFGATLSSFQVLQHRVAEMKTELDCIRAITLSAASLATAETSLRKRTVSAAKVQLVKSAQFIGRNAIQLHGGIGMTNEMPIGQFFKRLLVIETFFGGAEYHKRRFQEHPSELA